MRANVERLASVPALRLRRWGDELAVYDPGAARTHVLEGALGDILVALSEHPEGLGLEQLVAQVFADDDGDGACVLDELQQQGLSALIAELQQLGLVQVG